MNPLISVIIPIYNVESYIAECLESVLSQSYHNVEAICVDDCGTDSSMEIVARYAVQDERVRIIHHTQNRGLGPARNTGMEAASGDYILFLDSDDMLYDDALEQLYNRAKKTKSDVIVGRVVAFPHGEDNNLIEFSKSYNEYDRRVAAGYYPAEDNIIPEEFHLISVVAHGRLFSTHFLKDNVLRFIDQKVAHEDNGFFLKYISCMPSIAVTDIPTIRYRIRPGSIMTELQGEEFAKRRKAHLELVYDDARAYIESRNDEQTVLLIFYQLNLVPDVPYLFDFGKLFRLQWSEFRKKVWLLGVPLYVERLNSKKHKLYAVLGLRIWKDKDPLGLKKRHRF